MSEGDEQIVIGDYLLVNCIATGGSSQIWEVMQQSTSQSFAMKLLLPEALAEAEERNVMKHEAKVGQSLEHPHLVHMFDSVVNKKQAYIVMELFKSANLKSMIRGSLVNVHSRMQKLAEAVTSAYGFMHDNGWIHKDIKPDNILMTKASEVRVIDFSLATKPDSALGRMVKIKSSIAIQGTRTYIAPELIKRDRITPSADIYSLGISFYECLVGRPPFTGTNPNKLLMSHIQDKPNLPSEFHANISPQADALVMRMLEKKPENRHGSMQEVFGEVRQMSFFKMDPIEYDQQEQKKKAAEAEDNIDQRLNSRSDHVYTAKHGHQPAPPKPPKPVLTLEPEKPKPAAPAPPPTSPAVQPAAPAPMTLQMPPGMMPQMPHGYPQQYPPGMQPMPGMMPPPPGMYPQMPQGAPPQGMPPQAVPPQHQPPAQPAPAQPASPPAQTTPPPPPAPPAPEVEPEMPEDLDWLDVN